MTITVQPFTVEALSAGRVRVSWADATHDFAFTATHDGDQLTKVIPLLGCKDASIVRKDKATRGDGAFSYLSAATLPGVVLAAGALHPRAQADHPGRPGSGRPARRPGGGADR